MHRDASARRALWGLWLFFTMAVLGFLNFLAGLVARSTTWTLVGAALVAFATVGYLFLHFWTTTRAAFGLSPGRATAPRIIAPQASPTRRPGTAIPRANFDHLLSHTLERVPPPAARATEESDSVAPSGPRLEQRLVAAGPTLVRHEKESFVPAVKRRAEWIDELPIVKSVLGNTGPVTSRARPGKTRGQCSGCGTILWAPAERPIRLRCPQCGHTAWIES